jgi:hypothetical protein
LLALLGGATIVVLSRLRVKENKIYEGIKNISIEIMVPRL